MTPEPTPLVTVLPCDGERTFALMEAIRDKLLPRAFHEVEQVVANTLAAHRLAALEEAKGRNAPIGMALGLIAYITGLPEELRWTPEFTRYVSERADEIATAIRALSNKGGRDGE